MKKPQKKPQIRWSFYNPGFALQITGTVPGLALTMTLAEDAESEHIIAEIRALEAILIETWITNERRKENEDANA